jgi:hypothetical protein
MNQPVINNNLHTYLYAIRGGGFIKIGIADHPERRLAELQTACPYDLKLFHTAAIYYCYSREAETYAHKQLKKYHVRGEWFSCSDQLAINAVEAGARKCIRLHKRVPATKRGKARDDSHDSVDPFIEGVSKMPRRKSV